MSFDIIIGPETVRKVIVSLDFHFGISFKKSNLNLVADLSLNSLESFDRYQRPQTKETLKTPLSLLNNYHYSFELPLNFACYGLSTP